MLLNERYSAHINLVYTMIEKDERHPQSKLDELKKITKIDSETIKRYI